MAVHDFELGEMPLKTSFGNPRLAICQGWYFIKNNSGDRWIAFCNPQKVDFDPNFGFENDDEIIIAGPIVWP